MLKHKLKVCHQFSSFKIGACFEFSEGRGDYSIKRNVIYYKISVKSNVLHPPPPRIMYRCGCNMYQSM